MKMKEVVFDIFRLHSSAFIKVYDQSTDYSQVIQLKVSYSTLKIHYFIYIHLIANLIIHCSFYKLLSLYNL